MPTPIRHPGVRRVERSETLSVICYLKSVSNSEMIIFPKGQGNRGIVLGRGTMHRAPTDDFKRSLLFVLSISDSQIRYFIEKQCRTRVYAEAYF